MARYTGINHLAMATNDMDKTIRYWRDLLGMRLVVGLGRKGYRHYFFEISENDLLAFFEWPDVEKTPPKDHGVPVKGPFIFDHVSIGVDGVDDLAEIKKKLSAADFWVSEIVTHGFIYSIYSFDPNEIPVEFSCNVPGVDIRKEPKMKDKGPSPVTLEGPEQQPNVWPVPSDDDSESDQDIRIYPGDGIDIAQD